MSLINRMLQDLDARAGMTNAGGGAPTAIYEDLTPANDPAADGAHSNRRALMVVITLILTSAGIALGYLQRDPEQGQETATALLLPPAQAEPPAALLATAPPVTMNDQPETTPFAVTQQTGQAAAAPPAPPAVTNSRSAPPRKATSTKKKTTHHSGFQSAPEMRQKRARTDQRAAQSPETSRTRPLKTISAASRAEQHYLRGTAILRQGRIAEGEDELQRALNLAPDHHQARLALAEQLILQGRLEQSQEVLRQGLALAPGHIPYSRMLARLLVETGALPQALRVLEDARLAGYGDPEYLAFLAHLYQRSGRHQEAVENYTQALSLAPRQGKWWLGLGISYEALGAQQKALQSYVRAQLSATTPTPLRHFAQQRIAALQGKNQPLRRSLSSQPRH